ncbi:MAG: DinB family protein [Bacteroidetes bacterium]|nr:MAG: DinB family protein [Bacteroidota bacterium]
MAGTDKAHVLHKLDALDEALDSFFSTLGKYSEDQLNAPPQAGGWSALQAAHHLMLAEKYALQYCEKKLSFDPQLIQAGLGTRLRSFLVRHYDSFPIKFKAPKLVGAAALPNWSSLADLQQQWRQQRAQLRAFLLSQPEARFGEEVFKHPFAGRLDFAGMLDFFWGHFQRHRLQALRALR